MRTVTEIEAEIKKVKTAKRNAERKRARCIERLLELHKELKKAPAEAGTSEADAQFNNQDNCTSYYRKGQDENMRTKESEVQSE